MTGVVANRLTNVKLALRSEAGMTTAEYAVGTVASCGFAGILIKLLTSPEVQQFLLKIFEKAFSAVL